MITNSPPARMHAADGLLKSPLKLIGAKTGIRRDSPRRRIYQMIPPDCWMYVEPFLGSGGILIGKQPHGREMVNDLNVWPIHFFRMLQRDPLAVWARVEPLIYRMDEARFNEIRFQAPSISTDPYRAAAWYYAINKFARNGIVRFRKDGKCNSTYCKEDTGRGLFDAAWLLQICERIRDVTFDNLPYGEYLDLRVDRLVPQLKHALVMVLDPPYSQVFTKYNGGDHFADRDHELLAGRLETAEYRWILTINDNPFVRKLYYWANLIDNPTLWQCSNTVAGRGVRNELIITNFDPSGCPS